jgi:hypothetical protein
LRRSTLLTVCCLLATSFCASGVRAQMDPTRVYGVEDSAVPTPPTRVPLGHQDASALQELIDYLKAVNISQWQGLKATGSFTAAAPADASPDQASLVIAQGQMFRLDVTASTGIRSTRIADSHGETIDGLGHSWALPRATAKLGLVFFPRLLSSSFPTPRTSLIDQGQVQIQGRTFHRITVSEPLDENQTASTDPTRVSVIDLYFDSTTHLLVKSAAAVHLDSADRARYIEVLTYDDYRSVQNGLFAFRFHQSINGQPQWTLQLSDITLAPNTNTSDFYF